MKKKFTLLLLLCILSGKFFSQAQPGVAPSCPTQSIYAHQGTIIDGSSLPNGPPTAILSNLPAGAGGLAIGPAFGFPAPNPTWWTTNGGTYWYYDNTGNWSNTGHAVTNFAAVNLGGGATKLYNLVGGTGQVYAYSGTGPDVLLTTLVPPFGGGGPYDVQGDMADNFYILRGTSPQGIFCYNPQGVLTCSWSISGMIQQTAGGGFAILTTTNPAVQTMYYCSNGTNYIGNILPGQSNITSTAQPLPPGADYASCALPIPLGFVTTPQGGTLNCNLSQIPLVAQVNGNASLGWTGGYLTPTSTPITPTCGSITWAGPGIVSGQGTPTVNVNTPGVYSYTVTGCNGCPSYTIVKSFTVVGQNGVLTPSITAPHCFIGASTMSVSPNNNTNTVLWSGPGIVGANNTFTINFNQPGTYTAVVSSGTNCSGTATVLVNPSPTLTVTPNPANICFGGSTTLTASGAGTGGTYTWNPGALVSPSIAAGPSVTTVYTVVGTSSTTCTGSLTSTVVVNPIPVITATNTGPYCPGATIQLSVSSAVTYSWTGPNAFTSNLQSPAIANGQPVNSGTYSVTVTGAGGCVSSGTTNVVVNPAPTPTALANSPVCVNQTINLTGSGGAGYTWTGPNAYLSNLQNAVIAPAQATNAGVYTLNVISVNGCTNTATVNVVVNPLPVVLPGSNSPVCTGGNLSLTIGAFTSYSWTGPNAFTSNLQNPVITNAQAVNAGVYTVAVTNGNGCVNSGTVNVTVNPLPVISPTNTGPYCPGATIQLSVSSAVTYSWTGPNAFASNLQNPTIANGQPINSGTYSVTVTGAGGCISTGTTSVVVNPLPTPTALANSPVCTNQSINLSGSGGTTYTWTGPGAYLSNLQNPVIAPAQATNAGVYTLNVTSVNGCTNTTTVNVVVNALPVVLPGSNSPVCAGGNLSLTIGAFTSYSWSGPNGFTSNLQNPVVTNVQAVNAGVYTVAVTNGNGCVNSGTVSVIINPLPVVTPANTGPYCAGANIVLSVGAATSYTWSGPNAFTSNLQNPVITNGQLVNAGVYTVIVTSGGGCVNSGTTNVVVNPLPTPTATGNSPVCVNQVINLNGSGGTTYTWTGPGGYLSNVQNPVIASAQNTNAGTYTLTVTNGNGCTNFTTVTVVVNPLPAVTVNNPLVCLNQTINLTASGGTAYAWSGPLGYVSNVQNPVITNAQLNMSGGYTVVVTSAAGCTASAVANVTVITLPQPTITSNSPLCAGATLSLTGGGGAAYSWSGPNGFTSNLQNPTISNAQPVNSGIYTLTVTAGTCSNSTTASVTVNPLPTPSVSSSGTVCLLQPINLGASGGTAYAWTGPNGYSANTASPVISVAQSTNGGTYTVLVTGANGCNNTATTSVIVNPLPSPITNSPIACLNQPINLTSNGGVSYSWTGPNGFTSNLQNPIIANAQFSMNGLYTVVVTSAQNCTASATASVTVISLPQPSITSNTPCVGATLSFTGAGGTTYSWTGPNGFASSLQNPSIGNAQLVNSGVYTLIVTAGTCSNVTTYSATVLPLPTPTVSSSGTVCLLQPVNLGASGGISYAWTGPNGYSANTASPVISVAQSTNTGTYTVLVTGANGCNNIDTVSVLVNPLPSPITNSPIACLNQPINLTSGGGVSYNWTGPNGFTSNVQNPIIANAQLNMSGLYTVVVTSAQGCTNSAVASVTVLSLPQPSITSNTPCVGSTLSFNGGGGVTYSWSGPAGFSSSLQNPGINNVQMVNGGTYTLVVTAGTCSNSTTYVATINPLPVPSASVTSPVCVNQQVSFTGGGGVNYTWTGPGGFNQPVQNPVIAVAQLTNSGTYTLTVSDANSCVNFTTTNLTVNPLPQINVNNPTACQNGVINLTANGAASYTWGGPQNFTSNSASPTISFIQLNQAGTYTVIGASAQGCTNTAVANVQVIPSPSPVIVSNAPVCIGSPLSLSASGGNSYQWYGPNNFSTTATGTNFPSAPLSATGVYTLIATVGTCTGITTSSVLVVPLPTPTLGSNAPICENSMLILFGPGGYSYQWNGPNSFSGQGSNVSIANVSMSDAGTFTAVATDQYGCVGSATISVYINPLPALGLMGSTLCANSTITLSASGGTSYAWTGPQGFTSASATVNIPNSTTDMAGEYSVTVTDVNNCSNSAAVNVSINPVPQITIGSNAPICAGQTLSLTAQAQNAVLYYWHGPLNWLSVEQNPAIAGLQPDASGVYSVHVHDQIGCTGTATLDVLVRNLPQLNITTDKYSSCVPLCLHLGQQSNNQIVSGAWQFGEGGNSFGLNASYCYNNAGHYVIANTYTDNYGCVNTSTLGVDAWPIPVADFNISPDKPTTNENIDFTDATYNANPAAWSWYFSDESSNVMPGKNISRMFTDAGEYAAVLVVTSDHGCKDTIVKSIMVGEDFGLYVPDAFTPNDDGLNDTFTAKGIGISKFSMNIFDRWGELLYSTNSIENGWDGKFHGRGSEIVKQDIYVWKIVATDMQGKVHEMAGTVTVIR